MNVSNHNVDSFKFFYMQQTLHTIEDMSLAGNTIAESLTAGDIITLTGDLGTGKTTLSKGILAYFGIDPVTVTSPTFSIMNVYATTANNDHIKQIVHIDTYRLNEAEELLDIGVEEYLHDAGTLTIIEWPEKVEHILSSLSNTIYAYILEHSEDGRILKKSA